MKIELWPIGKPVPYARNARNIPQAAVDKVAASIREFAFRQPIVVDKDGTIVAGHTRLRAAQKLGLAEVPVHVASELTPTQTKAYRLADNRVNQESLFDNELLALELGTEGRRLRVRAYRLRSQRTVCARNARYFWSA
jgi:ParB-like chromosome segregation protein Spo0J